MTHNCLVTSLQRSGHFNIINILYSGLLIAGGYGGDSSLKSAEVYVPSTDQNCQIADLPAGRGGHTMENRFLCGGGVYNIGPPPDTSPDTDVRTSCLTLTDAGWEVTTTLLEER